MILRSTRLSYCFPSLLLMLAALLGAESAQAQTTVFDEVHTLAEPQTGVPVEHTFDISTAGTYTVTLTDLGATLTPSAPLASVKLAVTGGDALVGTALVGAGTLTLSALPPGSYQVHIVGTPGNTPGSGPIGISVAPAGGAAIASFQDTVALPSQALPNGESVLDSSFVLGSSGNYTVTLADQQLPQSLSTLTLLLIAQGGSVPVVTLPSSGALQANVNLTAGVTYRIFAVGAADSSVNAGLFTVTVAGTGGGAVVFGRAIPVGSVQNVGSPVLAAGTASLVLTDLKTPAALTQVGAVLTYDGQAVAHLAAAGTQSFTASPGTYQAYAAGTAPASPGAGSYAIQVQPASGPAAFSVARAVTAPGSTTYAYSFDTPALAAGAYTVNLTDFQFPADLSNLTLVAAQYGAALGTLPSGSTSVPITATAGPASLLVFTQATSAGGLFGLNVAPAAGGNSVFDATQGVGVLFIARQIAIPATGNYSVTATDLGFPAGFANYDTVVTQGATQLGSIFGGGTFVIAATPGNYFINFIAQPGGADLAGTYALTVASAPASPTVTLSSDHSSVASGVTVDLIWSSTNATTCTASGGWTGTQKTSGVFTSAALTANTTFTLACSGPGGTTSQSVSVTVTSGGGGGGGMLDWACALALAGALAMRRRANLARSGCK